MVFSSPALTPSSCSSKPGMKRPEPITSGGVFGLAAFELDAVERPAKSMISWSPSAAFLAFGASL